METNNKKKLLVIALCRKDGEIKLRHKTFDVLAETKTKMMIRNGNSNPILGAEKQIVIRKCDLDTIITTGMCSAHVYLLMDTEEVDRAAVRKWYKQLKQHTMQKLERKVKFVESLYEEVQELSI